LFWNKFAPALSEVQASILAATNFFWPNPAAAARCRFKARQRSAG